MAYKLQDFIDIERFQVLQNQLNQLGSFPAAIIDNEGKNLTTAVWQDICTQFHCKHPECEKACVKRDQYILRHLPEANPAITYHCPHGPVDCAMPILIDGIHYGHFLVGQFFLEPPDLSHFKAQALRYGFCEETYLEAVKKVPVWTETQLDSYLNFIKGLIAILCESGLKKLKETEYQKQIEDSEKRAQSILQAAMDGYWCVDPEGHLLEVSEAYCHMSGYRREELLGMKIGDLEAVETAVDTATHLRKVMLEGQERFETKHRRKDGSLYDVEISVRYMPDVGGQIFAFLQDITQRKQAEVVLRNREERFRIVADYTFDWEMWRGTDGRFEYVSPSCQRITGYSAQEFLQDAGLFLRIIHPDDRDRIACHLQGGQANDSPAELDFRILTRGGEVRWINHICAPAFTPDHHHAGQRSSSRDITERKRAEDQVRLQRDLALALASTSQLSEGLRLCMHAAMKAAGLDAGGFYLVDETTGVLEMFVHHGLSPEFVQAAQYFEKESDLARLVRAGQSIFTLFDKIDAAMPKGMQNEKLLFVAIIPLRYEGNIIGCMNVASHTLSTIPESSRQMLETLAVDAIHTIARLKSEERLRASEALLNSSQRLSKAGGWQWDIGREKLFWTEETYRIHGLQKEDSVPSSSQLIDQSIACYGVEYRLKIREAFRNCAERGLPYDLQAPFTSVDGRPLWVRTTAEALWEEGRIVRVIGNLMDITERHQAEAILHANRSRLQAVFRAAPVGIGVVVNRMLQEVNQRVLEMTGYTREELEGSSSRMLYPTEEDFVYVGQEKYRQIGERGMGTVETQWRCKDGTILDVLLSSIPMDPTDLASGVVFTALDITERKQAEAALRESEKHYRLLIETSNEGIWTMDEAHRTTFVNQAMASMLGYDPKEMIGKKVEEFFYPSDLSFHEERMAKRHAGLDEIYERRFQRRDGTPLWTLVSAKALKDAEGPFAGSFAMFTDITERKLAEMLLATRAELAELAQRASLDELVQMALDKAEFLTRSAMGFFHFVEKDQENLCLQQWSTNTVLNMCTAEGKGRHYPVSQAGVWVDCLRTRAPVIHNDYASLPHCKGLPPGHAPIIREMVVPILREGLVIAILGMGNKPTDYLPGDVKLVQQIADIVVDYALRKRAEHAQQESENRFRAMVENSYDGFMMLSADRTIVYVSPSFERFSGYSSATLLGPLSFDHVHLEDRTKILEKLDFILQKPGAVASAEFRILHRQGHWIWVETTAVNSLSNPHVQSVVLNIRDISDRKNLEAQLRQAQRLESIGQLAGGVAHDFNNMLAAILMNLSLLQLNPSADPDVRTALSEIAVATHRAANLTRQLLMFSRRSVLEVKTVFLDELVSNLLKMLERLIGEHIRIRFQRKEHLPPVEADSGMLEQVLLNLAVNARDAMPKGGLLTIGLELVQVDHARVQYHSEARPGAFICLSVADTGCGMNEATRQRIFEPFFTTKDIGKGTGLGLATVHGIVGQHHGWVEVESELGRGSAFRVFLPISAKQKAVAAPVETEEILLGQGTILLVEDELSVRKATARTLQSLGYQIYEAANGPDALLLWQAHRDEIGLLLTDMVMPGGMSGLDLAERLRQDNPALHVIVWSGYSAEMVTEGLPAGMHLIRLQKPFQIGALSKILRQCLDQP